MFSLVLPVCLFQAASRVFFQPDSTLAEAEAGPASTLASADDFAHISFFMDADTAECSFSPSLNDGLNVCGSLGRSACRLSMVSVAPVFWLWLRMISGWTTIEEGSGLTSWTLNTRASA